MRKCPIRAAALASGARHYFTGRPCKNGHIANKYVVDRQCVVCAHDKALRWGKANRDKRRKAEQKYCSSELGREKRKNSRLTRYATDPQKVRDAVRKWRKENPDRVRGYNRRREARRRGADGWHSVDDVVRIRHAQKDKCAYCREKLSGGGHVDHIMPIILGGTNDPDNLQITCGRCNMQKAAAHPQEFARRMGMLL